MKFVQMKRELFSLVCTEEIVLFHLYYYFYQKKYL